MKALFFLPIMTHQKQFNDIMISILIYWSKINVQIRLSNKYKLKLINFQIKTILETSVLCICSKQSKIIDSYDVIKNTENNKREKFK